MDRFFSKIKKTSTCWEWLASKNNDGYGRIRFPIKEMKAHRASWILHFGSIPDGLCVCHKCDNPGCVNPDHLFLGTHLDNMKDRSTKNRMPIYKGERHPAAILNAIQVFSIREKHYKNKFGYMETAKEFGISRSLISSIVNRHSWKHLP